MSLQKTSRWPSKSKLPAETRLPEPSYGLVELLLGRANIVFVACGSGGVAETRKRDITDFGKLDKDNQICPVFSLFSGTVRADATGGFGRPCFPFGKHWLQTARRSRVRSLWWVPGSHGRARPREIGTGKFAILARHPAFLAKDS